MKDIFFHQGELMLQDLVGSKERLSSANPIRSDLSGGQQAFFSGLPWIMAGGCDQDRQLWASLRYGEPGFIRVLAPNLLHVKGQAPVGDPLGMSWQSGQSIALLGLAAHVRRRVRVNGIVQKTTPDGMLISIQQSYGNCTKYIHPRLTSFLSSKNKVVTETETQPQLEGKSLSPLACSIIRKADTLFIASAHPGASIQLVPSEGTDISHRGGAPGFVHIQDENCLVLPDYSGNQYFNTLGNVMLNRQVALLFIEYGTSRLLWIRANASLIETHQSDVQFLGAERLLVLCITAYRLSLVPVPLRWQEVA